MTHSIALNDRLCSACCFLIFFFFSFRWHTKYTHRVLTHKHTHTEHAHYIHHPLQVKDVNAWLMTGSFLNFSHERNKKCSLDSPCAVVVFAAIIIDVLLLFQSDFNAYTHFTLHGIMHWRRIKRNDAERESKREQNTSSALYFYLELFVGQYNNWRAKMNYYCRKKTQEALKEMHVNALSYLFTPTTSFWNAPEKCQRSKENWRLLRERVQSERVKESNQLYLKII